MFIKPTVISSATQCIVIETVLVRKQPLIPFFRVSKIEGVKNMIQTKK